MMTGNKMELVTADALAYFRAVSEDTELPEESRRFASGFRDALKRVTELGKNRVVRQYLDSKTGADSTRKIYLVSSSGSFESFKEKFEDDLNASMEFAREMDGLYAEVNNQIREFVEAGGADKASLKYLDVATVALDMAEVAWEQDLLEKENIYQRIKPGVPLDERIASGVKSSWPRVKELLDDYNGRMTKSIVTKNALIAAGLEAGGQKLPKEELEMMIKKYETEKNDTLAGYVGGLVQNFDRMRASSYGAEQ